MNFDWVKVPKNKEEEKEQFDTLYHLLVRMSGQAQAGLGQAQAGLGQAQAGLGQAQAQQQAGLGQAQAGLRQAQKAPLTTPPMDEFTRLKLDILANFRSGDGRGAITPLETCGGCDRSFYSKEDVERHLRSTPACREWVRQGLTHAPSMDVPFFSKMEEGLRALLGKEGTTCRFCEKPLLNRRAHEKHLQSAVLCNRLAHHTFQSWYTVATLALPAPSSSI
jgi:hypothetical protein